MSGFLYFLHLLGFFGFEFRALGQMLEDAARNDFEGYTFEQRVHVCGNQKVAAKPTFDLNSEFAPWGRSLRVVLEIRVEEVEVSIVALFREGGLDEDLEWYLDDIIIETEEGEMDDLPLMVRVIQVCARLSAIG